MSPPATALLAGRSQEAAGGLPGERQLVAAIERIVRAPDGWSAVVLHLSRLAPPGPRPHHHRVARALMLEAAERIEGQIFGLRNGDLVLLFREAVAVPATLPATLRRLFGGEAGDPGGVVSEWPLPHAGAPLLAYTAGRAGAPAVAGSEDSGMPPAAVVDTVATAIGGARPQQLVQRQVAVLLEPAAANGVTMRQIYRELTISLEALDAYVGAPLRLARDPALLQHLGRSFDQRMLQILRLERGGGTPLDIDAAPAGGRPLALHLNLSLPGVLSDEFAAFAASCGHSGGEADARPVLAIEIALIEAVADAGAFARARTRLRQLRAALVLDGVSHHALLLARPAALQPDLIKLDWSPHIPGLAAEEQSELVRAIGDAGPGRVILQRADSEAAIRWGLAQGLRRFQGHHIDQMLAAQRMFGCSGAAACTLRQCVERMRATGGPARADCTNLPLLDAGLPAAFAADGGQ